MMLVPTKKKTVTEAGDIGLPVGGGVVPEGSDSWNGRLMGRGLLLSVGTLGMGVEEAE